MFLNKGLRKNEQQVSLIRKTNCFSFASLPCSGQTGGKLSNTDSLPVNKLWSQIMCWVLFIMRVSCLQVDTFHWVRGPYCGNHLPRKRPTLFFFFGGERRRPRDGGSRSQLLARCWFERACTAPGGEGTRGRARHTHARTHTPIQTGRQAETLVEGRQTEDTNSCLHHKSYADSSDRHGWYTPWTVMPGPKMSCSPRASWTSPGRIATSR